jgi:hypothetical protein
MDPNAGEFIEEERAEAWMERIAVGEVIKLKGEECEVMKIERREVTLKLLSAHERTMKGMSTFAQEESAAAREITRQRRKMLEHQR